jgi:purine-binding chemotaxis protein CheW
MERIMEKQLVIFELAEEDFGIEITAVEGIMKIQKITPIPYAPDYVEGVTNLRGSVVPVIDLRKRFGVNASGRTIDTRIVIVTMGESKVGIIVDAVSEVLTLEDTVIEPVPPMVNMAGREFIIGIAKINNRLVILLDLTRVLTTEEKQQAALLLNEKLPNQDATV